ncbi:hypothetical protein GCM10007425_20190 [Lysinibacillus alkalisoli]|uniref:DUF2269 family protein n=1 Tax=Lysinibacillus alkalisoli TaxID=1911548 RepID=A0A917LI58_9BACI|nr:hypothetical protein GCM10007425_20190 [Lysinibacillus alkalisoli]
MYLILLYIHIVSAILSIGPLFVLLPLLKRMQTASYEQMTSYLVTFQISIALVKHAGHAGHAGHVCSRAIWYVTRMVRRV